MNKTVNINLAGIFFHIDEDAYNKLQRYLDAIRRSFTDPQGRNEIISDIEARIAELFSERVDNSKQVVSVKEVDEVIAIMGQPEDYMVDEEIFDDEPKRSYQKKSGPARKLFRDTDNAYIGGVSAGLGHYFGLDPLWIRIAWVVLFFGLGTGVLVYILLWVLMPAAESTADKLSMSGKPVNITNIEEKVKEGFSNVTERLDEVTDRVTNADYSKVKSTSRSFFDALGSIFGFFFKIFAKFIGIILIIVGATTLIALTISLLTGSVAGAIHIPGVDFAEAFTSTYLPIWLVLLLTLFAVGIPFFYIFYLGLKILVTNLKSIGRVAHFTLLALWLSAIVTLAIFGLREAAEFSRDGNTTEKVELNLAANDTLTLKINANDLYSYDNDFRINSNEFDIIYDDNDQKKIYATDVRLRVRPTTKDAAYLIIERNARGNSYQNARDRASAIEYNFTFDGNVLTIDNYFLTDIEQRFRDQDVRVVLYVPEGIILKTDETMRNEGRRWRYSNDLLKRKYEGHYIQIKDGQSECLDCDDNTDTTEEETETAEETEVILEQSSEEVRVEIDSTGVNITTDDN
ncbi:MAG: PspC domain-containing protein [bacterium]